MFLFWFGFRRGGKVWSRACSCVGGKKHRHVAAEVSMLVRPHRCATAKVVGPKSEFKSCNDFMARALSMWAVLLMRNHLWPDLG